MTEPWQPAQHGADNVDLRRRVARGLSWTILDNWSRQLLQLVVFVVIARLLTPADFGLVALAMVFVVLANLFVDQGLGDALVQRRDLTRAHIDTAFWAALALGIGLTLGGVVLAIPIAMLLNEPQLQPILQALSVVFTLTALNAIQMSILRRELRFRSLALRTMFSIAGGGVVGVILALLGYGAWALVGQQLAGAGLSVLALWWASPWRPSLSFSGAHFRELFGFGANVVGSDLLYFVTRYSDNFLVGTVLGTVPLGIYAVGHRILDSANQLLIGITRKVTFPALARVQHEPERLRRGYLRLTSLSSSLILPGYVGAALVAPEMIQLLFGQRWIEAGPIAALLFLAGPAFAVHGFGGALFFAAGRPDLVVRLRLVIAVATVVGFVIAVPFGIYAVAVAFVIRAYLLLPLQLLWQRRYAGIPAGEYLARMRGPLVATGVMALAVLALKWLLTPLVGYIVLLAAEVVVGAAAYLAAIWLLERELVRDAFDVAGHVLPGGERVRRRLQRRVAQGDLAEEPAGEASTVDRAVEPAGAIEALEPAQERLTDL
jgi:PST family polysaccharide transporter